MLVCCGLVTLDVVQVVDALPGPDEKVVARSLAATFGGPAANAAATAVGLGAPTTLVTAVGHGPLAEVVRSGARGGRRRARRRRRRRRAGPARGLDRARHPRDRGACGREHERVGLRRPHGRVARRAGEHDGPAGRAPPWGRPAARRPPPGLALRVARRARERGCVVVLDGGSWKPDAPAMIGLCDAVVVSADFRPPGVAADDVLDAVAALGPRLVARTVVRCRSRCSTRGEVRGRGPAAGSRRRHPGCGRRGPRRVRRGGGARVVVAPRAGGRRAGRVPLGRARRGAGLDRRGSLTRAAVGPRSAS